MQITGHITADNLMGLEAYSKFRKTHKAEVLAHRKLRSVHLGEHITLQFESEMTIRYQIQEMLRVEKVLTDEGVLEELKAYNPLIPEQGQLSATLFIELTTDAQVREWLPKLVGIERAIAIKLSNGEVVNAIVEESHAEQLTRENVTAAVHYIRFEFSPQQIEEFAKGDVQLISLLPNYIEATELAEYTVSELLIDLQD